VSRKRRKVILPFTQRDISEHQMPHYKLYRNLKSRKLSQAVTVLTLLACSGEMQVPKLNQHIVCFDPADLCYRLRQLGANIMNIH